MTPATLFTLPPKSTVLLSPSARAPAVTQPHCRSSHRPSARRWSTQSAHRPLATPTRPGSPRMPS
eukprot:13703733-Alexandrium_andersonii.AAC.1